MLEVRATTAEKDLATATSELEEAKLGLKVKLEEQQNQFRAIEEEQYSDWEKRVCTCCHCDLTTCMSCTCNARFDSLVAMVEGRAILCEHL